MPLLRFTLLSFMVILSPVNLHASSLFKPDFNSAEHVFLGDQVKTPFTTPDSSHPIVKLHLPNGMSMTYGEILSFGDFYGTSPISQGKTEKERKSRFIAAFNSFAKDPAVISEATQILRVIHEEQTMLEEGIKKGETSEELYKRLGHDHDIKFNCITGGGCSSATWLLNPGRYLTLAKDNFDHFGEDAWIAYKTGHAVALEQARFAHKTNDFKQLEVAYAMNAFASHYLSDRFAAGHMRTPRLELTDHVTPNTIGSLLASFMHDEESPNGLHVHNLRGDHWIAYGDNSYLNPKNMKDRAMIEETLQASADQIFTTFKEETQSSTPDTAFILIPQPDEKGNTSKLDISPLFYWDEPSNQLMRREDTTNLYDKHWTSNWWGWSTLLKLQAERGELPEKAQAILAFSDLSAQALQDGLITNKELAAYIKQKA